MKLLKLDNFLILDVYMKEIRSLAEQGVPIWHSGLTQNQTRDLEKIKKVACSIILGENYESYTSALKTLGLEKLSVRRKKICIRFAKKTQKHKKFTKCTFMMLSVRQ